MHFVSYLTMDAAAVLNVTFLRSGSQFNGAWRGVCRR